MRERPDEDAERALRHVLWTLREFLVELVLIGGWVPHLYRHYGGFAEWRAELSGTTELDLLVTPPLKNDGGETLPEVLRQAGFQELVPGAVWESGDREARVEFMTAHRGPAQGRSEIVPVEGQDGLGAISLEGLSLLHDYSTTLLLPVVGIGGVVRTVRVRVPTLGAYALNKALTFPYRPAEPGEAVSPKRAKDILYLRDLMAAGEEVVERIATDLREIGNAGLAGDIERARSNIYLVLHGAMHRYLSEAAETLAERDRLLEGAAEADLLGHLTDLHDVFQAASA